MANLAKFCEPQEGPSREALGRVAVMARQQLELEGACEELAAQLKEKQKELYKVRDHDLPELMQEVGLRSVALEDGTTVTVEPGVACSIAKAREEEAFGWMLAHGFGALIKQNVTVLFDAEEAAKADKVRESLSKKGFDVQLSRSVHGGTLKKFVREQVQGDDGTFPRELFNVYEFTQAKIKSPRNARSK